jgi:sigma-B regulation protein RsbU (phosphoserine phosphatase)
MAGLPQPLPPGLVALALGDVSGKGLSASLVMSNLQASLRAQATILAERLRAAERAAVAAVGGDGGPEVELPCGVTGTDRACAFEEIVSNINAQLCQSTDSNRFATLFLALYDDRTRSLRYTNAGHNAPFLVRADGAHQRLEAGGTVAGAFDFARYEEAAAALAPGDLLLVFSDGVSEAQNYAGEEYGEQRLLQLALKHRDKSADELRRIIFAAMEAWSGGRERDDDQTVVIVKASK